MPAIPTTSITPPVPMPNVKDRSCNNCDHFQADAVGVGPDYKAMSGHCRAHPPGFCCADPTLTGLWPHLTSSGGHATMEEMWCDEWKRQTYPRHLGDGCNSKNPTLNPKAICCKSCDHFQPSTADTIAGLCLAHPPHACCIETQEPEPGPYTQENAFSQIELNHEIIDWCDEWKRTTNPPETGVR